MAALGDTASAPTELSGKYPTIKLKYTATKIRKNALYSNFRGLPYLGLEHIRSHTGELVVDNGVEPAGLVSRFRSGHVLFGKLRPYLAKIALPNFEGTCSTEVIVLESKPGHDPRFLRYVLLSKPFLDVVVLATYGTKMPRTSWEIMGNIRVPNPPFIIQQRIADFLDQETERIDEFDKEETRLRRFIASKVACNGAGYRDTWHQREIFIETFPQSLDG